MVCVQNPGREGASVVQWQRIGLLATRSSERSCARGKIHNFILFAHVVPGPVSWPKTTFMSFHFICQDHSRTFLISDILVFMTHAYWYLLKILTDKLRSNSGLMSEKIVIWIIIYLKVPIEIM